MGRDDSYRIAARPKFYTKQFERVCPYYIAFGMTYDEFWNGDNEMPRMFRKAHEIRQLEADHQAWLQGAYVYQAIGALAPALKAFAKGSVKPYMDQPFGHDINPIDNKEEREKVKEEKNDESARSWMEMWAMNFNDKFDKNNQEKGGDVNG